MKLLMIILLAVIALRVAAPPAPTVMILYAIPVNPYEPGFRATGMVESKGDLLAYNDIEKAYGCVQIREIRLRDYNNRTGSNYSVEDLYDYEISRKIYMYYASKIDYRNPERIAREWNGWVGGMKKKSTEEYWGRISSELRAQGRNVIM